MYIRVMVEKLINTVKRRVKRVVHKLGGINHQNAVLGFFHPKRKASKRKKAVRKAKRVLEREYLSGVKRYNAAGGAGGIGRKVGKAAKRKARSLDF